MLQTSCACVTQCSGSRGIGNETVQHHDKIAADWLGRSGISTPTGLNYMQIESSEGQAYLTVNP
jgi:RNA-splicing ligase RtcB